MHPKCILLSFFMLIACTVSAQDKIFKRNGDIIEGKVKEVNTHNVIYKRQGSPDGPDHLVMRIEVAKIQYENGSEDYLTNDPQRNDGIPEHSSTSTPRLHYGANILSVAPINLSEYGYGFGLAYEHSLDKRGMLNVYLPLNVCVSGIGPNNGFNQKLTVFQATPGVKFYPTGNKGQVRYAVGPQFVYETGTRKDGIFDQTSVPPVSKVVDVAIEKFGVMINNSVNVFPTPHLFIGVDGGLGVPFSSKETYSHNGEVIDRGLSKPLVQFNFRVGYRF